MTLLLLGAGAEPNVRNLFAQNEPGLAIDIGDRNGASEAKRTWRRNLLGYSEQFSSTYWAKLRTSISIDASDSPLGLVADKLVETAITDTHYVGVNVTVEANRSYTLSVYAKAGERNFLVLGDAGGSFRTVTFNLTTGAVDTNSQPLTASITAVDGWPGWYRCSVTYAPATTTFSVLIGIRSASGSFVNSYLGDGTSGLFIVGAQLELGSSTTYQPITDFNTEFKQAYPNHSLYVDSNGVAPAVYPGDQVGLVIDSSRGGLENLGAEKWDHASVDVNASESQILGVQSYRIYSSAGSNSMVRVNGAITTGKWYRVEFTIDSIAVAGGGIRVGDNGATFTTTGKKVSIWIGELNQAYIKRAAAACDYTISNVSFKEIPGIHPYQTTSGSRPALCRTPDGGRRNLLTYSEQFDVTSGGWAKPNATITANAIANPLNGELTADSLNEGTASAYHNCEQTITTVAGASYTFSIYLKYVDRQHVNLSVFSSTGLGLYAAASFDIQNGTLNTSSASGAGYAVVGTPTITDVGNGWYRCVLTMTAGSTAPNRVTFAPSDTGTIGSYGINTYTGTSKIFYHFGAQLEVGSTATNYQRVTTTHDVTESGKRDCWGLLADGSDDSLITASVDFSGTDKMTVMAGVRKNSDATAIVAELTASLTTNAGSFYLVSGQNATDGWWSASRGNAVSAVNQATNIATSAIDTGVISSTHDIAGDLTTIRRNGVAGSNATGDKGSGNFSSSIIYLMARGGSSLRFPGILYTLIIRGAATPTGTIADFEKNLLRIRAGLGPF